MKFHIFATVAVVCGMAASSVPAAVTITGTRVIYPAQDREVNVRVNNTDSQPALVQAWLDDGDVAAAPNKIKVPFALLPSVFRVEPHRGQAMRIMFTGGDMPKDRESIYWLNVLEIPSKPQAADGRNMIQFAFRTRIKMFYRPSALQDDPVAGRDRFRWHIASNERGEQVLRLDNPSPYYVSFGKIELDAGNGVVALKPDMAPPFGYVDFVPQAGKLDVGSAASVSYTVLNDFGSEIRDSAQIDRARNVEVQDN
ncbi:fimbria/pilus periplasmic chaperone [Burkholderia pyrrocinia]|nr:fimbria/pilus periplasmic chaperone [Burkholderia pyrrocinia]EKS9895908.1 fimbria/pilus periplasmic chaperone [Burkholderia pyrrocinia]EKS9908581.1 fimbria/pilus periplasmic chaperone [Burkholderia pyrrocinia]